jgi:hypothetical protein
MDAKELIYRYEADPSTEECLTDLTGEAVVPQIGDMIQRKGQQWRVADVVADYNQAVLLYRIFLTRKQP